LVSLTYLHLTMPSDSDSPQQSFLQDVQAETVVAIGNSQTIVNQQRPRPLSTTI
jgi:hypothetical protein